MTQIISVLSGAKAKKKQETTKQQCRNKKNVTWYSDTGLQTGCVRVTGRQHYISRKGKPIATMMSLFYLRDLCVI